MLRSQLSRLFRHDIRIKELRPVMSEDGEDLNEFGRAREGRDPIVLFPILEASKGLSKC